MDKQLSLSHENYEDRVNSVIEWSLANYEDLVLVEKREGALFMVRLMHIQNRFEKRLDDFGEEEKNDALMPSVHDSSFSEIRVKVMGSEY